MALRRAASQTFIVVNRDLCKAGLPGDEAAARGVVKFIAYGLGEELKARGCKPQRTGHNRERGWQGIHIRSTLPFAE